MNLNDTPLATAWHVIRVHGDKPLQERVRQLEEIGFLPGERVSVMTRALPGGDPLVVRVGLSTFALRAAEAACIEVQADPSDA